MGTSHNANHTHILRLYKSNYKKIKTIRSVEVGISSSVIENMGS